MECTAPRESQKEEVRQTPRQKDRIGRKEELEQYCTSEDSVLRR